MYEIGRAIIFAAGLLEKAGWLITDLFHVPIREVLPRYRARCFFRDLDEVRIFARSTGWDCWVTAWLIDDLMRRYGYI